MELKHYGILGMKWGVRKASTSSPDHTRVAGLRKKKLHEMSNEEIRAITTRKMLEKQYKDLNPGAVAKGKKAVSGVLGSIGKLVATAGTITTAAALGKQIYLKYRELSG